MRTHPEQRENEIYLGNHCIKGTNKSDTIEKHLNHLKTLRLGEQAYDLDGKKISQDYYRPLFVDKSEFKIYDETMVKLSSRLRRGEIKL